VGAPTKRPIFGQRFSVTPNTPTQGVWAELREGTPAKIWESTGGFAEVEKTETGGLMVKVVTAAIQAPSSTSDGSATVSGTVTVQDIPVLSDPANSSAGAIFKSPAPSSSATPEALAITCQPAGRLLFRSQILTRTHRSLLASIRMLRVLTMLPVQPLAYLQQADAFSM
jgi:hypothetical protein